MPVTFLWFLFDWRGRLDRKSYRLALLGICALGATRDVVPGGSGRAGMLVVLLTLIVSTALDAKRLHDIDCSAWWIPVTSLGAGGFAWCVLPSALTQPEVVAAILRQSRMDVSALGTAAPYVVAMLSLGALLRSIPLSTKAGTAGPNRFDHDPRAGRLSDSHADAARGPANLDLLIATALAERARPAAGADIPHTSRHVERAGPVRKSFGRRGTA